MASPVPSPDAPARRQAVKELLDAQGHMPMTQRREVATRFGCTVAVITNDIAALRRAQSIAPATLLLVAPIMGLASERDVAVLRALGRLEVMTSHHIKALLFSDTADKTMRRHLHNLEKQDLIWKTTTSMPVVAPREAGGTRRIPPKAPYVFGLTHEGKAYLQAMDAEPDTATYALLKSRDRRAPAMPQQQLTHDLLASSWCCSMIDAARRCSLLVDIRCQVEYVSAFDEKGKEMQRFDAYLALRFARQSRLQRIPGWWLPWYDGDPDTDQHITARFALEVDRGTEKLAILLAKAHMYGTLTASGHYKKTLGGPVTPVVLAQPGRRPGQIATEWRAGWPGGAGVISTPLGANHSHYGALWGQYYTMKDDPALSAHLLAGLVSSVENWEKLTRAWVPGVPPTMQ